MALKSSRRRKGVGIKLTRLETEKLQQWEDCVEKLAEKIGLAELKTDVPRSEKPLAMLKVGVYEMINNLHGDRKNSRLEAALVSIIEHPLQVSFAQNPYHWGFAAISASKETALSFRQSISEYSRELVYARRHRIPKELLIGFISQVGGAKRIIEKLDENSHERWYHPNLPWLQGEH